MAASMSYLDSRIAAPVSSPRAYLVDGKLLSLAERRPPGRRLNPCPTELKEVALMTEPRDLVEKGESTAWFYYYTYVIQALTREVLLTLASTLLAFIA